MDGDAGIGDTVTKQRTIGSIIFVQACHGTVNALKDVVAVGPHERLSPVILLLGNILTRVDIGRRLVANHVIAVAVGVSIMAGIVVNHVGRQSREDHVGVVGLEVIKHLGHTMRLEAQEDGRSNLDNVITRHEGQCLLDIIQITQSAYNAGAPQQIDIPMGVHPAGTVGCHYCLVPHSPQFLGQAVVHIAGIASEEYLHSKCKIRASRTDKQIFIFDFVQGLAK